MEGAVRRVLQSRIGPNSSTTSSKVSKNLSIAGLQTQQDGDIRCLYSYPNSLTNHASSMGLHLQLTGSQKHPSRQCALQSQLLA